MVSRIVGRPSSSSAASSIVTGGFSQCSPFSLMTSPESCCAKLDSLVLDLSSRPFLTSARFKANNSFRLFGGEEASSTSPVSGGRADVEDLKLLIDGAFRIGALVFEPVPVFGTRLIGAGDVKRPGRLGERGGREVVATF